MNWFGLIGLIVIVGFGVWLAIGITILDYVIDRMHDVDLPDTEWWADRIDEWDEVDWREW